MHSTLFDNLLPALTWTLLHSIWQGMILTVLAGLVLLLTRRSTAAFRYTWLCTLFFLFLCGVFVTLLVECRTGNEAAGDISEAVHSTGLFSHPLFLQKWIEQVSYFLNEYAQWVVMAWLVIFLFKSGKMLSEMGYIKTLSNHRKNIVEGQWATNIQTLAGTLGIRKTVLLAESVLVKVPVLIGYFKPIILVPVGLLNHLSTSEAESVLLHELAHIRRHDYLVNFIQRLSELLFFFNPGLLWVSSLLRAEREVCCDEMAISYTGNKLQFVEALLRCKERSLKAPAFSLGLFGKKNLLHQRLERIVTNSNKTLSPFETSFFVLSIVVLTMFFSGWGFGKKSAMPPVIVRTVTDLPSLSRFTKFKADEQHVNKNQVTQVLVRELHAATTSDQSLKSSNQEISKTRHAVVDRERKPDDSENAPNINIQAVPEKVWISEITDDPERVLEISDQIEQDRLQVEKDREQAEKDRKQAAREKEQARKDRQQAEKDREQARKRREQVAEDQWRMGLQ